MLRSLQVLSTQESTFQQILGPRYQEILDTLHVNRVSVSAIRTTQASAQEASARRVGPARRELMPHSQIPAHPPQKDAKLPQELLIPLIFQSEGGVAVVFGSDQVEPNEISSRKLRVEVTGSSYTFVSPEYPKRRS